MTVENTNTNPRLSKYLSQKGICSRREADNWITQCWITIDGKTASLGQRIYSKQKINISPSAFVKQKKALTFLLNKPIGYVSGQPEDGYPHAMSLLIFKNQYHDHHHRRYILRKETISLRGLAPAGRLDIDSTGLLIFTQDGRLAKHLIGKDSDIEKEYLVRVTTNPKTDNIPDFSPTHVIEKLQHGLFLDGIPLKPAKVQWKDNHQLRIILTEGRKRQIRRMCDQVGLKVLSLKRIRIGKICLNRLPVGKWRFLKNDETF